uniref:Catalase n=1 Tax=viral metagenome TaxID=1070528 RepID=A0A6M3LYX9_9ZZZZ
MYLLKYLKYVLRHKWYVMLACFQHGLIWRGITHDLSKLRSSEFFPYAWYFYGPEPNTRDESGYYKPTDTGDKAFDFAWLLHQKRNRHHWQFWVLPEDGGGVKVLEMKENDRVEMVCDWIGAGMAISGRRTVRPWWDANRHKMQLHPDTEGWIERWVEMQAKGG